MGYKSLLAGTGHYMAVPTIACLWNILLSTKKKESYPLRLRMVRFIFCDTNCSILYILLR